MKCHEFDERISAYLEEELGADTRAEMEGHAAVCTTCAQRLSQTRALTERLGRLRPARPSAGFDFALRSRLLMEVSRENRWGARLEALFRPALPRFALAGATAALILLGAASVLMEEEQIPGHAPAVAAVATQGVAPPARTATSGVTERGALKLKALSAESYPVSGRYYRDHGDSLRAAAKRLPSRTRTNASVRPVAVRF
jgi:anti-sigma factor RsiW